MNQTLLIGYEPTAKEAVQLGSLDDATERAIELLLAHEPGLTVAWGMKLYERHEGYYLAFSGGKDSVVIKHLAKLAGVKFDATYSATTIDPPELIRYLKTYHRDVRWRESGYGNMMARIQYNGMPTRFARWCCREFKENGGEGRVCVFGVRAAESKARELRWREVSEANFQRKAICPIVYWTDAQVWEFILQHKLPYCELYDEGFDRLGCIGCPLKNGSSRKTDFKRWPRFERNWKEACRKYWETHKDQVLPSGKKNFCAQFRTWQAFWRWWMADKTPDIMREECQTGLLWTNQQLDDQ